MDGLKDMPQDYVQGHIDQRTAQAEQAVADGVHRAAGHRPATADSAAAEQMRNDFG